MQEICDRDVSPFKKKCCNTVALNVVSSTFFTYFSINTDCFKHAIDLQGDEGEVDWQTQQQWWNWTGMWNTVGVFQPATVWMCSIRELTAEDWLRRYACRRCRWVVWCASLKTEKQTVAPFLTWNHPWQNQDVAIFCVYYNTAKLTNKQLNEKLPVIVQIALRT